MSRRSWVASSLVSRPEIFCWVLTGRTPRSLMLFVGQIAVSSQNRVTSSGRSRQNSSRSRPGRWAVLLFARRVLVVAHDAVVLMLRQILEGLSEADLGRLGPVANASLTSWARDGTGWRLATWNETAHLR